MGMGVDVDVDVHLRVGHRDTNCDDHSTCVSSHEGGTPSAQLDNLCAESRSSRVSLADWTSYASCNPGLSRAYPRENRDCLTCTDGTIWIFPLPTAQKSCAMMVHSLAVHSPLPASPFLNLTLCGGKNGAGSSTAIPFHEE